MSRTLAQVRDNVAFLAGRRYFVGVATAMTSTTLTSPDLQAHPDDYFVNLWVVDSAGTHARITRSRAAMGLLTVQGATALIAGRFTIMSMHPNELSQAINDASRFIFNTLDIGRRLTSESIITGSPIYNSNFEEWETAGPVGWTTTGRRESRSQYTYFSEASVRLGLGQTLTIDEGNNSLFASIVGRDITVHALVKAEAATALRLTVGANVQLAAVDSQWQVVSFQVTPNTAHLLFTANNTLYIDRVWVDGVQTPYMMRGPSYSSASDASLVLLSLTAPFVGASSPYTAFRVNTEDFEGGYTTLVFLSAPPVPRILRMVATVPLSSVAAPTDTVEISNAEAQLLETEAAIRVLERTKVTAEPRCAG